MNVLQERRVSLPSIKTLLSAIDNDNAPSITTHDSTSADSTPNINSQIFNQNINSPSSSTTSVGALQHSQNNQLYAASVLQHIHNNSSSKTNPNQIFQSPNQSSYNNFPPRDEINSSYTTVGFNAQNIPHSPTINESSSSTALAMSPASLNSNSQSSPNLGISLESSGSESNLAEEVKQTSHSTKCRCRNYTEDGRHIPRPRNAFILFRQYMHNHLFSKDKGLLISHGSFKTNSLVSREIGQRWRSLSEDEKNYWHGLAKKEKELHKLKYPNYKYIPRKLDATNSGSTTAGVKIEGSDLLQSSSINDTSKSRSNKKRLCEYCRNKMKNPTSKKMK
ncbi:hypothetical protein Kpol_401p4 [Vanderwaltozyma polyspora DSM 70294]|uniref:HMG box domain-containing protein n=1 Tax=Vanderwaltozyma polyspora (strain ATCC 22028 / DSM 70294 / BCRC 21397 / CBS 2163 / NBRC 10782 / NRRL Y-8283 / UCD 57-17) TaxID=436907 RepID=A7TRA3_VANPO|nr:uncharacterized protein Kpol_401p4 [Vanderwaltozyma polyspora DSM 70294]EDO15199.1 hypothetical protein Kpol_401p4 [Vanderwaltozyma polyspora DSM 70294]